MPHTLPDAASDLRQYLDKLPTVKELRDRLRQHRDEGKLLRRLLKLAADAEAVANSKRGAHHA
jgi:hypothetical protein